MLMLPTAMGARSQRFRFLLFNPSRSVRNGLKRAKWISELHSDNGRNDGSFHIRQAADTHWLLDML